MEGDWELIFLFIVVISTRSFDLCKSYSLSTRSPRSYSRAIAHDFHPRSMVGVSFLESSWRASSRTERLPNYCYVFFHCWEFFYRFLVLLEGGEARCVFFACRC